MREDEKLMLFEQVIKFGYTEAKNTLVGSVDALAALPDMLLAMDLAKATKHTQIEDGRIFRNEELMLGPDGSLVVKKELQAMVRKIEKSLRR